MQDILGKEFVRKVSLLSKSESVKWPRYEVQTRTGLTYKEALRVADIALRRAERQILTFSQFSYDSDSGVIDTRVRREDF